MAQAPRPMHLAAILQGSANHKGAWRRATSNVEATLSPEFYVDFARRAEAAKLDALFFADSPHLDVNALRSNPPINIFEPLMLSAHLAAHTSRIGLVSSVSTTFTPPYTLARQFASLDRLSGGRAGWNIVTSAFGERNYGAAPLPVQAERYAQAGEALEVAKRLWDGWDAASLRIDRASGQFADVTDVRRADFHGRFFDVEGPLNVLRPPQGWPVLFQAGASPIGRDFAAAHAEVVFAAEMDLGALIDFDADIRRRAVLAGRSAQDVKILSGLTPIIAATEDEARRVERELAGYIHLPAALGALGSYMLNLDLSALDLDAPIPVDVLPPVDHVQGRQSRYQLYRRLTVEDGWTLRRLAELQGRSDGHWTITGSPEQIADAMAERFLAGGGDGFIVMPTYHPECSDLFLSAVVPILQGRGLFRQDYSGTTLRAHFNLDLPPRTGQGR